MNEQFDDDFDDSFFVICLPLNMVFFCFWTRAAKTCAVPRDRCWHSCLCRIQSNPGWWRYG